MDFPKCSSGHSEIETEGNLLRLRFTFSREAIINSGGKKHINHMLLHWSVSHLIELEF